MKFDYPVVNIDVPHMDAATFATVNKAWSKNADVTGYVLNNQQMQPTIYYDENFQKLSDSVNKESRTKTKKPKTERKKKERSEEEQKAKDERRAEKRAAARKKGKRNRDEL